jgi:putative ABC transport system permease protein
VHASPTCDRSNGVPSAERKTDLVAGAGEAAVSLPSDVLTARAAAAGAFNSLFLGLGVVALIVGAVGVANIMIISVLERRSRSASDARSVRPRVKSGANSSVS